MSTFYPVALSAELHLGIRQQLGKGSWEMNRSIYRAFLRLLDYEATLDRLGGAWRQYNSRARCAGHDASLGSLLVRWSM